MYYFYRCRKCFGLITRLQMQAAMDAGPELCRCGGGSVVPTNPMGLEWLRPGVLWMVAMKLAGRLELAPSPSVPVPVPVGVRSVPALANEEKWVDEE